MNSPASCPGTGRPLRAWHRPPDPPSPFDTQSPTRPRAPARSASRVTIRHAMSASGHAYDDVALAVCLAVEVGLAALVGFGRDHRRDAALAQSEPDAPAAVGLVTSQLGRPQARPSPADAPDCAAIDQGGDLLAVMHLAAGQGERDRLAVALAAHMDLGREAAARAAERLIPG